MIVLLQWTNGGYADVLQWSGGSVIWAYQSEIGFGTYQPPPQARLWPHYGELIIGNPKQVAFCDRDLVERKMEG